MAENKFKGKSTAGIFPSGEGPVWGQKVTNEAETKGLLDDLGTGKHPKMQGTSAKSPVPAGAEDKGFDVTSKSYRGPQNFTPEDKGTSNPFDINRE
jgi:hypothetical protein